jgi:hypothetical protein
LTWQKLYFEPVSVTEELESTLRTRVLAFH